MRATRRVHVRAAVVVGVVPVLAVAVLPPTAGMAAGAVPPASRTLTAAEATAAVTKVVRTSLRTAQSDGVRQTTTRYNKPDRVVVTAVVDPRRDAVRLTEVVRRGSERRSATGVASSDVMAYPNDLCVPDGRRGAGPTSITRDGRGTWSSITPRTSVERSSLRLLDREKARWARSSRGTVGSRLRSTGLAAELARTMSREGSRILSGTATPTASGSTYVIEFRRGLLEVVNLRSRLGPEVPSAPGRMTLKVDGRGALRSASIAYAPGEEYGEVVTIGARYGARTVTTPKERVTIGKKRLVTGCSAVWTRRAVRELEKTAPRFANRLAKEKGRAVRVADIRANFPERKIDVGSFKLDVRVTDIRGGVAITGRHRLLPHPVVSTVFVRNGKAVAHRVR